LADGQNYDAITLCRPVLTAKPECRAELKQSAPCRRLHIAANTTPQTSISWLAPALTCQKS
jgi:hypothetical protein